MHYVYAVEPDALISDWESCRYLSEKFGFDRGRVLALYPKAWIRIAYEALANQSSIGDVERKRICQQLNKIKREWSIPSGCDYDPSMEWLANACLQQDKKLFRAVITKDVKDEMRHVLSVKDIDETHKFIKAKRNYSVPLDIETMLESFKVLLRSSSRIAFVDPYFDITVNGYRKLLARCLNYIDSFNSKTDIDIEIHYKAGAIIPNVSNLKRDAAKFREFIPERLCIDIYGWVMSPQGEDFHDRFLLTNRGGISIGRGFKPLGSHKKTDLSLMSSENVSAKLNSFSLKAKDSDLNERPIRIFSDGNCEVL